MKGLNKFISLVTIFVLIVSSMTITNVFAANKVTFTAKVDNKSVKVGDEVHCLVNISNNTGWGAITLDLCYDTKILEFVSATNGSALGTSSSSNNDNKGYYSMVLFTSTDNITANGTLVDITFKAVAAGTTEFTFDKNTLDIQTADLEVIDCNFVNGSVTVNSATTSTSTSTTTTKSTSTTTTTTTETTTETTTTTTTTATTTTKERATETTTISTTTSTTTTESGTETTTVRKSSSSGGGGSRRHNTTTTSTTEETTEETTQEYTQIQNDDSNTVRISIGSNKVLIGGKPYDMDVSPYIQESSMSTMVPIRFASLAIMGDYDDDNSVMWNPSTKTATILFATGNNQRIVQFTAGSSEMIIDGNKTQIENNVKAEITDGRMFIPFRALGTALGVKVDWESETKTAIYIR